MDFFYDFYIKIIVSKKDLSKTTSTNQYVTIKMNINLRDKECIVLINKSISQAIKASSWIAIEYENTEDEITKYWIAIQDIDVKDKSFFAYGFNFSKINNESKGIINIKIRFDRIKSAYLVENTTYNQSHDLIPKIYANINELEWLGYDSYNDETLDYIFECIKHEEVAYQHETTRLVSEVQSYFVVADSDDMVRVYLSEMIHSEISVKELINNVFLMLERVSNRIRFPYFMINNKTLELERIDRP